MTIINFDKVIGKESKCIMNNIFCLNHPKNCLIVVKTNSGKTNILMYLLAQNTIYEKIHIFTNNLDNKHNWLKQQVLEPYSSFFPAVFGKSYCST